MTKKLVTAAGALIVVLALFEFAPGSGLIDTLLSLPARVLSGLGGAGDRIEALVLAILVDWFIVWIILLRILRWRDLVRARKESRDQGEV